MLSLDVFDTLLWRKVPDPHNVFALLALRLIDEKALDRDLDAGAFALLRLRAEELARARREESGRGVEVTLREIWQAMPDDVLAGATKDDALGLEVELERSLLVPDLDILDLVIAAQEHGKRVVGVSDTYFSEAQLGQFLDVAPLGAVSLDRVFAVLGPADRQGQRPVADRARRARREAQARAARGRQPRRRRASPPAAWASAPLTSSGGPSAGAGDRP